MFGCNARAQPRPNACALARSSARNAPKALLFAPAVARAPPLKTNGAKRTGYSQEEKIPARFRNICTAIAHKKSYLVQSRTPHPFWRGCTKWILLCNCRSNCAGYSSPLVWRIPPLAGGRRARHDCRGGVPYMGQLI